MKLDDRFYESPRARAQHERMMRQRAEEARQRSTIIQKLEREQHQQHVEQKLLFCLWYMLDLRYQKALDNGNNADAQTLRNACEDIWFAYINHDRTEYVKYM